MFMSTDNTKLSTNIPSFVMTPKLEQLRDELINREKIVTVFEDSFSEEVWSTTYKDADDLNINYTMFRVAAAVASKERTEDLQLLWTRRFYDLLTGFKGTAGGRIYANAGTSWGGTTLMNCYVGPRGNYDIDSLPEILHSLESQAATLKSEGGWGENFSYIRPRGAFINGIGVESPGAVKYMELFDKSSDIITSGSGKKSTNKKAKKKIRKGAMMGVMDVWHPDIIEFITAKQQSGRLNKFNLSVNCTDEFMERVNKIKELESQIDDTETQSLINSLDKWDLYFPDTTFEKYKSEWDGNIQLWKSKGYPVKIYNTVSVKDLWKLIMESTYNRAEPGVLFLDRANKFGPLSYAENIFATNPCFTGDTRVATEGGLVRIDELAQTDNIPNVVTSRTPVGDEGTDLTVPTNALCTGVKPVVAINLSNGMTVRSTPDHLYWTANGEYVQARDLVGCSIELNPLQFNTTITSNIMPCSAFDDEQMQRFGSINWTDDIAFILGVMTGDGWMTGNKIGIIFGKKDVDSLNRVTTILSNWGYNPTIVVDDHQSTTIYVHSKALTNLFRDLGFVQCRAGEKRVPSAVFTAGRQYVSAFLDGLFGADGSVISSTNSNRWISLCSKSKDLLNDVQQLLMMYGILHHTVYHINKESTFEYTTVGGEQRSYVGGSYYDLRIFGRGIVTFAQNIKFTIEYKQQHMLELLNTKFKSKSPEVTVISIDECGVEPVYDLTIPITHNFVLGTGMVVHNCGEQTLAPGNVCNLGSLNLVHFINDTHDGFDLKKIKKYTQYLVRFLDNVSDLSNAPLPIYEWSMRNKRRIGCGILGWGSALYMLQVRLGSEKANELREQVMSTLAKEAYSYSVELAEEKGMFSLCDPIKHANGEFIQHLGLPTTVIEKMKRVGIRNSSLLSIQPTGNCVTSDSVIKTNDGEVTIHDIISQVIDINYLNEGDVVKLNNPVTIPTFEGNDTFDSVYVNGLQEVLGLTLETGDILKQTVNHKYLIKISDTEADWIEAGNIKPGMKIISME